MGSLCGGNTQTTTSQQSTTPTNLAGLQSIFGQVQNAAQTPFTPFTGESVAPVNDQQRLGIAGVNDNATTAQPYYSKAADFASTSGAPISADAIQHYINPFTSNVIDATKANFAEDNGQAQNSLKAKAAMSGALGGSGQGVAQAELVRQQQLAQAPVIAQLQQKSYEEAVQAAQADRAAAGTAAGTFSNIGTAAQRAGIEGAGAQINAGTLEQQTQQQKDAADYRDYLQRQAYPFQTAQFSAQYGTPAALAQGTSTSGSQTSPGPSIFAQLAGLGIAGAGVASKFAADGGRIEFADGGSPFNFINDVHGYVPIGGNAPQVSLPQSQLKFSDPQKTDMSPITNAMNGIGKGTFRNPFASNSSGGWGATDTGAEGVGSLGGLYSHGGLVEAIHHIHRAIKHSRGGSVGSSPFQGYADGGAALDDMTRRGRTAVEKDRDDSTRFAARIEAGRMPDSMNRRDVVDFLRKPLGYADGGSLDDRFSSVQEAISDGSFDPVGKNSTTFDTSPAPFRLDRSAAAPQDDAPSIVPVPQINPMRTAALPPQITGAPQDDSEPSSALAYDGTPQNTSPLQLAPPDAAEAPVAKSPFGISPKGSDALIATGLGIMASRSPFALSAIGEGGLHGLKNYSDATAAEREAADKKITQGQNQKRIDFEAQRIAQSASQFAKTQGLAERRQKLAEDKTPEGYRATKDGNLEPIPNGPADPATLKKVAEAKRIAGAPIDDDTASFVADQVLAGDSRALIGFGRGAQGAENLIKVRALVAQKAREQGLDPTDILNNVAIQSGNTATQRTFGTQTAKMAINATEAQGAIELGRTASAAVPRTNWVPVNKAIQAYQSGTSDPALAKFGAANLAIINTYARAISPTGVPTVNDKVHAEHLLSTATGPQAYNAVLDQMNEEIKIAHAAPSKAKKEIEDIRKGRSSEPAPKSSSGAYEETKDIGGKKYGRVGKDWFAL